MSSFIALFPDAEQHQSTDRRPGNDRRIVDREESVGTVAGATARPGRARRAAAVEAAIAGRARRAAAARPGAAAAARAMRRVEIGPIAAIAGGLWRAGTR